MSFIQWLFAMQEEMIKALLAKPFKMPKLNYKGTHQHVLKIVHL